MLCVCVPFLFQTVCGPVGCMNQCVCVCLRERERERERESVGLCVCGIPVDLSIETVARLSNNVKQVHIFVIASEKSGGETEVQQSSDLIRTEIGPIV